MLVRILSAWAGSPTCGSVADVPDAIAADRVRTGWAEAVEQPAPVVVPRIETAEAQPRTEVRPAFGKKRRG